MKVRCQVKGSHSHSVSGSLQNQRSKVSIPLLCWSSTSIINLPDNQTLGTTTTLSPIIIFIPQELCPSWTVHQPTSTRLPTLYVGIGINYPPLTWLISVLPVAVCLWETRNWACGEWDARSHGYPAEICSRPALERCSYCGLSTHEYEALAPWVEKRWLTCGDSHSNRRFNRDLDFSWCWSHLVKLQHLLHTGSRRCSDSSVRNASVGSLLSVWSVPIANQL